MSRVKNPQEKKRLSYEKDRRNCYGENDKSSRKNIRRNKKLSSKSFRSCSAHLARLSSHEIEADFSCELEAKVFSGEKLSRLKGFRKVPDQSLKEHIQSQERWRGLRYGRRANS